MKKRLSTAVSLLLASVLFLTSCSSGGGETSEKQKEEEISWQDTHVSLGNLYDGVTVRDGVIYGYCENENGTKVVSQDLQSGEVLQTVEIEDVSNVQNIAADAKGNIYLVEVQQPRQWVFEGFIWKIDTQGQVSSIGDLELEDMEEAIESDTVPKGIFIDDGGNYYLWYEVGIPARIFFGMDEIEREYGSVLYTLTDRIYVKDADLNALFYEQIPESEGYRLLSFFFDEGGSPVILAKDPDGVYIEELSVEQGGVVFEQRLDGFDADNLDGPMAFTEDGFLFCKGNELYRYYYETEEQELLFNLSSYGVLADNVLYLGIEDGVIQVVDNYGGETEYSTFVYGVSEKETLTFGLILPTEEIEAFVAGFNRSSDEVRIELAVYDGAGEDYAANLEQLKMDIVSGEAPDIMDVSEIDLSMFSGKGAFADLYELMEADESFDKDMLVSSAAEAFEENGHLYSLGYAFQLYSIWGAESVVQGRSGISADELAKVFEENGKNANALYGVAADEPLLTMLCAFAMDSLIDWENAECSLSGDYMGTILDFAKGYGVGYTGTGISEGIASGDILLTAGVIDSVADYQLQDQLYGGVSFIGYPTESGSGTAVGYRGTELAVSAESSNQEAAWEFVKYCVENGYSGEGFPMLKTQFEEAMQKAMTPEYTTAVDGDGETEEVPKESLYDGDSGYLLVYAASRSDVEAVEALVESADTRHQYNTALQEIIDEEAETYFSGQSSLNDTVERIQERITIYLQEQM